MVHAAIADPRPTHPNRFIPDLLIVRTLPESDAIAIRLASFRGERISAAVYFSIKQKTDLEV
jgi:hypothetical protein